MPETTSKAAKRPAKPPKAAKTGKGSPAPVETAVAPRTATLYHRPLEYTEDIAEEVCWRLAHGESLVSICSDDHLPHCATIYRWLIRFPAFCETYTRAREDQADTNADEILAIADEKPPEFRDDKGRVYLDQSYLLWQKQRIEARKWTAAKLKPKKYGDRLGVHGVEGAAPIATEETSSSRLFDIIRNLEMTKRLT
jgi:hypothetical protein